MTDVESYACSTSHLLPLSPMFTSALPPVLPTQLVSTRSFCALPHTLPEGLHVLTLRNTAFYFHVPPLPETLVSLDLTETVLNRFPELPNGLQVCNFLQLHVPQTTAPVAFLLPPCT